MIRFLKIFFLFVLLTMLIVTTWASLQGAIWAIPGSVSGHPWFIATLFDTYFAFLVFYCWLAYKETSSITRFAWLVAILLLGNIAIATYMIIALFRLPKNATIEDLLLRPRKGSI
jgi:hypothetical protein